MGNKLIKEAKQSNPKKILKNRFFKDRQKRLDVDSFILKYHHLNENIITDISQFEEKRLLFVSLFALLRGWKKYPTLQLYSAIIIIPLKEKWIYDLEKYAKEMQFFKITDFTQNASEMNEFVELIKWKNNQGLVFWILDDYSEYANKYGNELSDPFWNYFNFKLTQLYDPVTRNKYKSLKFDEKWWRESYKSIFDVKLNSVLHELYCVTQSMKYKSIQEIICQSNPKSFIPIASSEEVHQTKHMIKIRSESLLKFDDEYNADERSKEKKDVNLNDGNWVIADDYC